MNRIELSTAHQVRDGAIKPLGNGTGVQPVACTPVAIAALAICTAATAYYAFRDFNTSAADFDPKGDLEALGIGADGPGHLSVGELTGAMRAFVAR